MSINIRSVPVEGDRYTATVPDTLDLAERAAFAINGLGGVLDPASDYDHFFFVTYTARPPYMYHMAFDATNTPKFAESFPFMRVMSGSEQHVDSEHAMMSSLVSRISPDDGLYYSIYKPERPWHSSGHPGYPQSTEDFANLSGNGRMLRSMIVWRERDGDPAWDDRIRAMSRGLEDIAVHRDDYAYFPDGGIAEAFTYPRSGWRHTKEPTSETEGGEGSVVAYQGHPLLGLAWWHQVSGDEQALTLARKLANFIMLPKFWGGDNAATLPMDRERGHFNTHFHARMIALRGLLQFAMATDDRGIKDFVRSSYEYARTHGIPRIGYFTLANHSEGCSLGDMTAMAIKLSDAGVGDYWDDVDCIARNLLVEQQLVNADLLERISETGPARPAGSQWRVDNGFQRVKIHPGQESNDRVIERSLGVYAGGARPTHLPNAGAAQCCTSNATQGLYYAWEGAVRERDGTAQVNLLLNRASPWLDIDSYLPYQGKVLIHNKTVEKISVRIPSWVPRRAIRCQVGDQDRRTSWTGNYLVIEGLSPGDRIKLEFPIAEETVSASVAEDPTWRKVKTYSCTFKGNTLIDISPRGDSPGQYPIFLREQYKQTTAPMREVTRYVYPGTLRW